MHRLTHILHEENIPEVESGLKAVELIAKMADGGMRDAITLLDKCLSYSNELTVENVIKALGVADYDTMLELTSALAHSDVPKVISTIDGVYSSGVDLRQFVKTYFEFVLDCSIYDTTHNAEYVKIPDTYFDKIGTLDAQFYNRLLTVIVNLQNSIKYEGNPKSVILATLILFMEE
jgi:DNA polymerase-3 subunit gamma/tau